MGKVFLTEEQKISISLLLLRGLTLKEVAAYFGCSYAQIVKYWRLGVMYESDVKIDLGGKHEPYYYNEDDYGKIPTYKRSELSIIEQLILKNLK